MFGWRGRLGLIVPSSNTTNEPEFYRSVPTGVSVHTARMRLQGTNAAELASMADDVERCAQQLADADVDAVVYGCTTGSLVKGPEYDTEIEDRIADIAGVPAVATAASIKRAFEALSLTSLAIVTPYIDDLNERERSFLEAAGFDIVAIDGLGIEPNTEIGTQWPEQTYREARQLDLPSADGVFVSCTNYRTFEIIPSLEQDLGKPVITSNQATLWDALKTLGVTYDADDLGSLFTRG
jgi:maleate isomerase